MSQPKTVRIHVPNNNHPSSPPLRLQESHGGSSEPTSSPYDSMWDTESESDSAQYDSFRKCDIKDLLKGKASHSMLGPILKDNPKPKPAAGRPNIRRAREEMAPPINQNTLDAKEPPAEQNEDSINEEDIAYERRVNTMCGGCFRLRCPALEAADGKRPGRECPGRKAEVETIVTSDDWAWLSFSVW